MTPEYPIDYEAARRAYEDNSDFRWNFRLALSVLSRTVSEQPNILDYGAGPGLVSVASKLRRNQQTTAYDPGIPTDFMDSTIPGNPTHWIKEFPKNQRFDLAVFHFALHHGQEAPSEIVRSVSELGPSIMGIADYDFSNASLEDFKKNFIAQQEQIELYKLFNGDWQACFDYHRKYGLSIYKDALTQNGFSLIIGHGEGFAANKFALIGHKLTSAR